MKKSLYCLLAAALLIPGRLSAENQALQCNAAKRSYVEVPCFQTTSALTVEAWVKSTQSGTGTIVAWKDVANDGESVMFRLQNGKLQYGEWLKGYVWNEVNSTQPVNTGVWTHVAVVRQDTKCVLYVNGVENASSTLSTPANSTTDNLKIGALGQVWSECFDGSIDEVRIWSVARSAQEIADNYQQELTGEEQGLEGYWKFDGNADDASPKSRNGAENEVTYGLSDIFDVRAPEVSELSFRESTTALPALHMNLSRGGNVCWCILEAGAPAPTAEQMKKGDASFAAWGTHNAIQGGEQNCRFDGELNVGTTYVPYAMLTVSNGDASEVTAGTEFTYGGLSCLPPGWTYQNIGGSEADGRSSYADGVFTIHGSGTDIWHVADAFNYTYCAAQDDVEMVAHVADLKAKDAWTKVGIMLRDGTDAGSRHVFICTTPGQGTNSFARTSTGGTTSVATVEPEMAWLKLIKKGRWVATYASADGEQWQKVGMNVELRAGQGFRYIGLAVCGHGSGEAVATFDHVAMGTPDADLQLSDRGIYFPKKEYVYAPIPQYADIKDQLPRPVLDDNKDWVNMYYKAWEIGIGHIKRPQEGSPLVSNFYDEAFDSHIFQWDMLFMTIFGRYADHVFPGVESLDNFYCRQHESGCITRCLTEATGEDNGDENSDNIVNPPLFSWAEWLNYKFRGDAGRLRLVLPTLEKYDEFVDWKRRGMDTPHKLYWNNGQASGMDNLPRDIGRENLHHASDHQGWVDMSAQVVIQKECLADICRVLAEQETDDEAKAAYLEKARKHALEAQEVGDLMNRWLWNEERGLYNDVDTLGIKTKWKTIAAFWPLLAGITDEAQDSALVGHLRDEASFWRDNVFPALPADEEHYSPRGGYWCGGVWAPSNYAVIKGLERKGINHFAHISAMRYINAVYDVYKQTDTFWENYAPEKKADGRFNHGTNESDYDPCRRDFIGWTGLAPISLLIENVLGFRADGPAAELTYDLQRVDRHGIQGLHFGGITTDVVTEERASTLAATTINVTSDKAYTLIVLRGDKVQRLEVQPGTQQFVLDAITTGIHDNAGVQGEPQISYEPEANVIRVANGPRVGTAYLYDTSCRKVMKWDLSSLAGSGSLSLPVQALPAGTYIFSLGDKQLSYSKKLIIR